MRYPEGHKEQARAKIIEAASAAIREQGIDKISISALMNKVGLTHGGFYAHFANRDELVAEAIKAAGHQTRAQLFEQTTSLEPLLKGYLSMQHVEQPAGGCVVAALGSQGHQQPEPIKEAFDYTAHGLLQLVQDTLNPDAPISDEAITTTSRMVGAVILARLIKDPELSARILSATQAP